MKMRRWRKMPAISKIRLTNIVYENGDKRFNDEVFLLDGNNGAILLENGGGKTVFIHTVLQAILPHTFLGNRKIKETLELQNAPAHIGIEWIISERPRRYVTTVVSLFLHRNNLESLRYVFEYEEGHSDSLENIPFVRESSGNERPSYKEEMSEYYSGMKSKSQRARTFDTITNFHDYIEEQYQIIKNEWESVVRINSDEGGIEKFFEDCKTTNDLYDRLLIPTVEDSITGHEKGMFANMFEKQREGFQKYHLLKKSMEENASIQTELAKYIVEFEKYSVHQANYAVAKQDAKGLAIAIREQSDVTLEAYRAYEVDQENLTSDIKLLNRQQDSLGILLELATEETLKQEHLHCLATLELEEDKLRKNKRTHASMLYAKAHESLLTSEQLLVKFEQEIEASKRGGEVDDYEAALEQENSKLHGYYVVQLDNLEKQIKQLEMEQQPVKHLLERNTGKLDESVIDLASMKQVLDETNGSLHVLQEQNKVLSRQLLVNPWQKSVAVEFENWQKRNQHLDERIVNLKNLHRKNTDKAKEIQVALEAERKAFNKLESESIEQNHIFETIRKEERKLISRLAEVETRLHRIDDLYLTESSVYSTLLEQQTRTKRKREERLKVERLAYRYVDDYEEQAHFFADSFLAERLKDWHNQAIVIRTGPDFYAALEESEKVHYKNYPLWAMTLVTRKSDKEKLLVKLAEVKEQLQYPISVLTMEEAKQIGEEGFTENWISPAHWRANLDVATFAQWKQTLQEIADEKRLARVEKEEKLALLDNVISHFQQFFSDYPKEYLDQVIANRQVLTRSKESAEHRINQLKKKVEELHETIEKDERDRQKFADEKQGIENLIAKVLDYNKTEADINKLSMKQRKSEDDVKVLEAEVIAIRRIIKESKADKAEIIEKLNSVMHQLENINLDEVYVEVKQYKAIYSEEMRDVLRANRQRISDKIRGIQSSYDALEVDRKHAVEAIRRFEIELDDILRDNAEVDKAVDFPPNGDLLIRKIKDEIKAGEVLTKQAGDDSHRAEKDYVSQVAKRGQMEAQFKEDFPVVGLFVFDSGLSEAAHQLAEKQLEITGRSSHLQMKEKQINKNLHEIRKAENALGRYEEAYEFNLETIRERMLTEKERTDFTYNQMKFVKAVIDALQLRRNELKDGKASISKAKIVFNEFCKAQITDRKLREAAMKGIDYKTTYQDVLTFQNNMIITLERADSIARNYISDQDKEVQAFINSIYHHLTNVIEQLRVIPKNTKIKTHDKSKEIFKFTIPDFVEEDGKSRIRKHMDWILEQLETGDYKDDQGMEDSGKVRNRIETWLDTKQLLRIVMDNQGMRVSCRKVTNDNQVTSVLTTWEQSNKWSGGEKWSKNMTLFLGILNFVAEKKQHMATNMKRSRAVILDNPFGKASSDHVLNPVFFIAEQLGFQIIALTAHSDGKFLQDYFPVNYSLKLRPTKDGSKQIMTTEKQLHTAYFQNHEPEEMGRLEVREQLELL